MTGVSILASVVLALTLLLPTTPAGAQDKPRPGREPIFVVPAEPPSFDAHREETFAMLHPGAPHYSTLMRVDPADRTGTKFIGDLAESWTVSTDRRTYTFKIRQGVKFHDGSVLTPRDVKASYDHIIVPPPGRRVEPAGPLQDGGGRHPGQGPALVREERALEKRLYDEEVHDVMTFQWHRIVPHLSKVRGWQITPSHYLNNQLDTVWLSE